MRFNSLFNKSLCQEPWKNGQFELIGYWLLTIPYPLPAKRYPLSAFSRPGGFAFANWQTVEYFNIFSNKSQQYSFKNAVIIRTAECVCSVWDNGYNIKQQPWASGRRQHIWDIDYFVEVRLLRVSNLIRPCGVDFNRWLSLVVGILRRKTCFLTVYLGNVSLAICD